MKLSLTDFMRTRLASEMWAALAMTAIIFGFLLGMLGVSGLISTLSVSILFAVIYMGSIYLTIQSLVEGGKRLGAQTVAENWMLRRPGIGIFSIFWLPLSICYLCYFLIIYALQLLYIGAKTIIVNCIPDSMQNNKQEFQLDNNANIEQREQVVAQKIKEINQREKILQQKEKVAKNKNIVIDKKSLKLELE